MTCPTCKRQFEGSFNNPDFPDFPFCSPTCHYSDLYSWLNDEYSIPVPDDESEGKGDNDY